MKTTSTKLIPVILFLVSSLNAKAYYGNNPDSSGTSSSSTVIQTSPRQEYKLPVGLQKAAGTKKTNYKRWKSLGYSGYIRSYNQYRHLPIRYANQPGSENLVTFNGLDIVNNAVTGYQEPLFLLRIEGAPTVNTNFKLEYAFDHQLTGLFNDPYDNTNDGPSSIANRRAMAYRIFQFTANTHTKIGDFKLIAGGGVNWYRLSPFTMWQYQYRDDMFERYPWQPEGSAWGLYNSFYAVQDIPRDQRWGNTGTQGFILEGKGLPLGLGFSALFGKTDNSGGFQTYLSRTPKNMAAGRLERAFGKQLIGTNYFTQFGFTSSEAKYRVRQQILTADARLSFDKFRVYAEGGIGRYQDSVVAKSVQVGDSTWNYANAGVQGLNYNWDPIFNLEVETYKDLTLIPLKFQYFYIGKGYVNINSAVLNSANPHALTDLKNVGTANDVTTFRGAVTDINQMTNNRMGAYLKHDGNYGKLKLTLALGASQELENVFDTLSFWHKANAFTRSRFAYYSNGLGPYGRILSMYRRTYEVIGITDNSKSYKKGYNTIDFTLKYKINLLKREMIVFTYGSYNSVQRGFQPIPVFTDKAFVRTYYEEFMAFYAIHPKLTLIGFYSFEIVKGNKDTELADAEGNKITATVNGKTQIVSDPNGKTIDQFGFGYGVGLDYDITSRAGLYLRNRWFEHTDKNFTKDKFKGIESTVELKIFF